MQSAGSLAGWLSLLSHSVSAQLIFSCFWTVWVQEFGPGMQKSSGQTPIPVWLFPGLVCRLLLSLCDTYAPSRVSTWPRLKVTGSWRFLGTCLWTLAASKAAHPPEQTTNSACCVIRYQFFLLTYIKDQGCVSSYLSLKTQLGVCSSVCSSANTTNSCRGTKRTHI